MKSHAQIEKKYLEQWRNQGIRGLQPPALAKSLRKFNPKMQAVKVKQVWHLTFKYK